MAAAYNEPCSIEVLRELLTLEPGGVLRWKQRPTDMFEGSPEDRERLCKTWNTRFAGKEAGAVSKATKYKRVSILGIPMKFHRVVFALHNGRWPDGVVDHEDGVELENGPQNLRSVDQATNMKNQKRRITNSSGVMGVSFCNRRKNWCTYIHADGRRKSLGSHPSIELAAAARRAAEIEHGYHQNHGR